MLWLRAFAVWVVTMVGEVILGILREVLVVPLLGDRRARQVGVLTGSIVIMVIATLFRGWLRACTNRELVAIGLGWVSLTLCFELTFGRAVLGYPWSRIASDYDIARGGLLPLGLVVMALSPLLAAKMSWRENT